MTLHLDSQPITSWNKIWPNFFDEPDMNPTFKSGLYFWTTGMGRQDIL